LIPLRRLPGARFQRGGLQFEFLDGSASCGLLAHLLHQQTGSSLLGLDLFLQNVELFLLVRRRRSLRRGLLLLQVFCLSCKSRQASHR